MVDTFDDVLIREEYAERMEALSNSKRDLEAQLERFKSEKDDQLRKQEQKHISEFEAQLNEIKQLNLAIDEYLK